jgi:hypothetical protein
MIADRLVDHVVVAIWHAGHDRQILFFHLPAFELGREQIMNLIVLRDDDYTARVSVESVHDARAGRSAAAAQRTAVVCQRAGQRPLPMPLRGMNDHARWLVDYDDRIVFVQYRKRNVLGRRPVAGHVYLPHHDLVSRSQSHGGFGECIVDVYVSGVDRASNRGPTESWQTLRQE